jgi:tetratricopeptide (TPR) repeat protein
MSTMPTSSPRPARSQLFLRRTWAVVVALASLAEPLTAQAQPLPTGFSIGQPLLLLGPASLEAARAQARTLTEAGQAAFDAGDYRAAAASWQQILDVLPEDSLNREERENALLIALEAYKHEYRQAIAVKGSPAAEDVERLRLALVLCREYAAELTRVYGAQGTVDGAVFESRAEIEAMLAEAGKPPPETTPTPTETGPQLEPTVVQRGRNGTGLIVGGAIMTAAGLSMISLVVIGARDLKRAEEQREDAENLMPEDRKRNANAMLISGSVLLGVLTAGGATMLALGIRRRVRYMAFSPTFGPTYVGVGASGRF